MVLDNKIKLVQEAALELLSDDSTEEKILNRIWVKGYANCTKFTATEFLKLFHKSGKDSFYTFQETISKYLIWAGVPYSKIGGAGWNTHYVNCDAENPHTRFRSPHKYRPVDLEFKKFENVCSFSYEDLKNNTKTVVFENVTDFADIDQYKDEIQAFLDILLESWLEMLNAEISKVEVMYFAEILEDGVWYQTATKERLGDLFELYKNSKFEYRFGRKDLVKEGRKWVEVGSEIFFTSIK